jgi:hypothetical protein
MRHKWFVAALTFVGVLATLLSSAPYTPAHAQSGGGELA